jgi:hypothetical protein
MGRFAGRRRVSIFVGRDEDHRHRLACQRDGHGRDDEADQEPHRSMATIA